MYTHTHLLSQDLYYVLAYEAANIMHKITWAFRRMSIVRQDIYAHQRPNCVGVLYEMTLTTLLGQAAGFHLSDVAEDDFCARLYCNRGRYAGGDLHMRLLWTQHLTNEQFNTTFPQEWRHLISEQHVSVQLLAMELLKYATPDDVPSEAALRRLYLRWKRRQPPYTQMDQHTEEAAGAKGADLHEYLAEIDAVCAGLIEDYPQARDALLHSVRVALRRNIFDPETGLRRSMERFKMGLYCVEDFIRAGLEEAFELTEFSMANWQVICDAAMSKWRPYQQEKATEVGLNEIVYMTRGGSLRKPRTEGRAIGPLDAFDEETVKPVMQDVTLRLRRVYGSESLVASVLAFIEQDVIRLQRYRDTLLSLEEKYEGLCRKSPRIHLLLASLFSTCTPEEHLRHHLRAPSDYIEMATMCPVVLLSEMVAYICAEKARDAGGGMCMEAFLAWRRDKAAAAPLVAASSEACLGDDLWSLLKAVFPCPRCGSENTHHEKQMRRAADEQFHFQIICRDCKACVELE